jgi:hypothetical protein
MRRHDAVVKRSATTGRPSMQREHQPPHDPRRSTALSRHAALDARLRGRSIRERAARAPEYLLGFLEGTT